MNLRFISNFEATCWNFHPTHGIELSQCWSDNWGMSSPFNKFYSYVWRNEIFNNFAIDGEKEKPMEDKIQ